MQSSVLVGFIALSICVSSSLGATSRGYFNDPKYPGQCAISKDVILAPGQKVKDVNQPCGQIICGPNGLAEFQTCGVQRVHGCEMGDYINTHLPYPDCCARKMICP